MTERTYSKDEIAEYIYGPGRKYAALSVWGRNKVDHLYSTMGFSDDQGFEPRIATVADGLRRENLRLAGQLEHAQVENLELWDEISDLKAELEELRASFNPPSSSSAHQAQTNRRSPTN